ncbi:MAG: insulinase family protein [Sphaerochaetaceae bacterium]
MAEKGRMRMAIGDELYGFVLESIDLLKDYQGYGYFYRHRNTKMEVYHLVNEDKENFFSFLFKTPPVDDCGTPHIIEHCVLAGSKRYPVRDPFMALLKGSAQTFMNAMTYPDFTAYPAASPLEKDFDNLFAVYADAVFNPLLRQEVFWQEGVRLALNEAGELNYKGVVFNEMLGVFSDHDSIVSRYGIRSLFPDTPYFYESGGNPSEITGLNYRQLLGYYTSHYHPSNCRLFLYGDQDITKRLALLEELYLSDYSATTPISPTALAKSWTKPKSVRTTSPSEGDSNEATVTLSWATTLAEDPLEVVTLNILTEILLGNPGAPLYKAIIESGLSKDIAPTSGMEVNFRQMPFIVGFKGIDPEKAEVGERLILETLKQLVEEGIPPQLVRNAVKRYEFVLREQTWDTPVGLRAMSRVVRGWLQGHKPHITLSVGKALDEVKRLIAASVVAPGELFAPQAGAKGYFEQWIEKNLLKNLHRCLLIVKPDVSYNSELEASIERKLNKERERLDKEALATLKAANERFHQFEELKDSPQDIAKIPTLVPNDLPKDIRTMEQSKKITKGVPLYTQIMETNEIVYFDGFIRLDDLSEKEIHLLPLMTRLLHMTGVKGVPYNEMAIKIRDKTGGLYFFLESSTYLESPSTFLALAFRLKSLREDFKDSLTLLSTILREGDMDDQARIGAVLNDLISDYESNITQSAHQYAAQRASSHFSPLLRQNEILNGLDQWFFLKDLAQRKTEAVKDLAHDLEELRGKIMEKSRLILHLACPEDLLSSCEEHIGEFIGSFRALGARPLNGRGVERRPLNGEKKVVELFTIPATVSFNSLVCNSSNPLHSSQVHQSLLALILTTGKLWDAVRSVGGAYGVNCHVDLLERLCIFTSYRDPRTVESLKDFQRALEEIAEEGVDKEQLNSAIITTISREMRPLSPQNRALLAFRRALYGISDEYRKERRNWILSTTTEDIRRAAGELLQSLESFSGVAMIGSEKVLGDLGQGTTPLLS